MARLMSALLQAPRRSRFPADAEASRPRAVSSSLDSKPTPAAPAVRKNERRESAIVPPVGVGTIEARLTIADTPPGKALFRFGLLAEHSIREVRNVAERRAFQN